MLPSENKKTAWITGAAGFIGFRLAEELSTAGWDVVAIDALENFYSRPEHPSHAKKGWRLVERDHLFNEQDELLRSARPDLIFHMGACSDTMNLNESYHRKMNLEYSQNLWLLASLKQIPLVYASSAAVYGEGEFGYSDDEALALQLKPLNPYGESKRLFDIWALEQEKAGTHPPFWSGFRFFNVYGFGERHKGRMASVVVHAYDQIIREGKARLFKSHRGSIRDGEQKRDFISVEDVVKVLRFAADKPIQRGIFNLGTGQAQTFRDLVRAVFESLGRPEAVEFIDTPEPLRARYQYFTQAEMGRLRQEGYADKFMTLAEAVPLYIRRLKSPP